MPKLSEDIIRERISNLILEKDRTLVILTDVNFIEIKQTVNKR